MSVTAEWAYSGWIPSGALIQRSQFIRDDRAVGKSARSTGKSRPGFQANSCGLQVTYPRVAACFPVKTVRRSATWSPERIAERHFQGAAGCT